MRMFFAARIESFCYLADSRREWATIELSGLASFVVHETTRLAGCAELAPSYELQVVRPALAR